MLRSPNWPGWLWILAALVVLGVGLGMRDPSPPDEPRFALAAETMVASGDWLIPRRGSEFYAEKPAVFMWMQASALAVVGDPRIAFLLPSFLAGLATLVLVWHAAARLWGARHAPWAAGALFVCLQFGLQAKRAQIDMVLVAMTTLGLYAFLRYLLDGRSRRWLAMGGFACGLGTVTKGTGFLPLLIFLPAFLAARRLHVSGDPRGRWSDIGVALAGFIAGAAVWLAPLLVASVRSPDPALNAYIHELLFRQTATRYVDPWHHVKPAWYYLQVMATLWLPGALLLPWLLPAWWRRLRRRDPRFLLLLGWAALVLAFFSAPPGKREVYIFPALPAFCLAAAPLLPALFARRSVRLVLLGWLVLLGAALIAAGASGLGGASWVARIAESRGIDPAGMRLLLISLTGLGVVTLFAAVAFREYVGAGLLAATAALWITYGAALAPALDASSSGRALMRSVADEIGPSGELGAIAWKEQHALQFRGPFTDFGWKQPVAEQWARGLDWVAEKPAQRWLWMPASAFEGCVDTSLAVDMGNASREEWWLVPAQAILNGCPHFRQTRRSP